MKGDFFYSRSTGLYIARKPLVINSRVKEAAKRAGISLEWDDEGRINFIDYDNSRKLMSALEANILSPIEYWLVLRDATEENDIDMLNELTSDKYCEWLNRVYLDEKTYIDNPKIVQQYKYDGVKQKSQCPFGKPGWFNPEGNINNKTGEPLHVELNREKFATSWKYWSPHLSVAKFDCTSVRSYVTSVGKPSFDLGIPVNSRQPKLMVRECRYKPLTPVLDPNILEQAEGLFASKDLEGLVDFLKEHGDLFADSYDSLIYKLREKFFDALGSIALDQDIKSVAQKLHNIDNKELKYNNFIEFVKNSKKSLEDALICNKDIVFVMGHKNPDTDTVVSSLFEAWRNHLINGDNVTYIPIVQSTRMPDEVAHLLGEISDNILLTNEQLYHTARQSGLTRWISVDQNREPEVQKYFITIIDHHIVSDVAKNRDIPKTLEMLGSCSALITRKYLGMGFEFSKDLARILYGATLMDTENRVEHKMTAMDARIMDYLKQKAGVKDDNLFYGGLMSYLLNTDDANFLFKRDYKEDWGFGFAVAKVKNCFSNNGDELKPNILSRMKEMALQNNVDKNFPLTLAKITDYKENNETVNRERVYFIFNERVSDKFKEVIKKTLESIIRFEFPDNKISFGDDYIDFFGAGMQLSRKKTAPVLEPIVAAFNSYFYSPSIDGWVKRDFLKTTKKIREVKKDISSDSRGRVNYITYLEAKELADNIGFELLSLSDYWKALNDAKAINDIQMIESLQGSNFVEFLDSAIIDKSYLINHPAICEGKVYGTRKLVTVPKGSPGLIHPNDIDIKTGLPKKVGSPDEYGNPELWRYWEPDSNLVVPCRSYIFLLDQPSWDGKFHLNDSFPNMGLRPVVKNVDDPLVNISWDKSFLTVNISFEGECNEYKWPKKIIDYIK